MRSARRGLAHAFNPTGARWGLWDSNRMGGLAATPGRAWEHGTLARRARHTDAYCAAARPTG
jgi:hypothetical protein